MGGPEVPSQGSPSSLSQPERPPAMLTGLCSGGDMWALELVPIFPLKLLFRRDSSSAYTADIWGETEAESSPSARLQRPSWDICPAPDLTILGFGVSGRDVPSPAWRSPGIRGRGMSGHSVGPARARKGSAGQRHQKGRLLPTTVLCCKTQLPDSVGCHGGRTSLTICPRYSWSCPLGTGV